jgi:hypothetical protein
MSRPLSVACRACGAVATGTVRVHTFLRWFSPSQCRRLGAQKEVAVFCPVLSLCLVMYRSFSSNQCNLYLPSCS